MDCPLLICPGDPAGVGPDLIIELFRRGQTDDLLVLADPDMLRARARLLGVDMRLAPPDPRQSDVAQSLRVLPVPLSSPAEPGQPNPDHAPALLRALDMACDMCLEGQASGLVTGPLDKASINRAGIPFIGHTEYLANHCQVPQPVMLLACPALKVALVTTHLPLREVPDHITPQCLTQALQLIWQDSASYFALHPPRILVCGLNPHAGEQGYLGREEEEIISPVLKRLSEQGMAMEGPCPADSAFSEYRRSQMDVFVCMYHDQGLPVLKALGFGEAVNITLGLPIIRTATDHGTALQLAGSGRARVSSITAAIRMAREMVIRKRNSVAA